jgi:hypothetical protein
VEVHSVQLSNKKRLKSARAGSLNFTAVGAEMFLIFDREKHSKYGGFSIVIFTQTKLKYLVL